MWTERIVNKMNYFRASCGGCVERIGAAVAGNECGWARLKWFEKHYGRRGLIALSCFADRSDGRDRDNPNGFPVPNRERRHGSLHGFPLDFLLVVSKKQR